MIYHARLPEVGQQLLDLFIRVLSSLLSGRFWSIEKGEKKRIIEGVAVEL